MKGCLIAATLSVLVLLGSMSFCSYSLYRGYENFPEYAKKDAVYEKYKGLLKKIDECVVRSDTVLSLAANLEKTVTQEEVVYLALVKSEDDDSSDGDGDTIEIIRKYKGGVTSSSVLNGTGYGKIDGRNILIIEYDIVAFADLEKCVIYLEYNGES